MKGQSSSGLYDLAIHMRKETLSKRKTLDSKKGVKNLLFPFCIAKKQTNFSAAVAQERFLKIKKETKSICWISVFQQIMAR